MHLILYVINHLCSRYFIFLDCVFVIFFSSTMDSSAGSDSVHNPTQVPNHGPGACGSGLRIIQSKGTPNHSNQSSTPPPSSDLKVPNVSGAIKKVQVVQDPAVRIRTSQGTFLQFRGAGGSLTEASRTPNQQPRSQGSPQMYQQSNVLPPQQPQTYYSHSSYQTKPNTMMYAPTTSYQAYATTSSTGVARFWPISRTSVTPATGNLQNASLITQPGPTPNNNTRSAAIRRRRFNGVSIIDPHTGHDILDEIFDEENLSHPSSEESSARQTPEPALPTPDKEVQATFAKQVSQVINEDKQPVDQQPPSLHEASVPNNFQPQPPLRLVPVIEISPVIVKEIGKKTVEKKDVKKPAPVEPKRLELEPEIHPLPVTSEVASSNNGGLSKRMGVGLFQISNSKLALDQNDLLKLTCSFCKKHLSIPPILTSEDGKTYKCGRCPTITSNTPMQENRLYEILAKYVLFPCSESSNCKKMLVWDEVKEHETKCLHRSIFCPISNCSAKFEIMSIEKHFQNNHPSNIQQQTNLFDSILRIKGENIYLMTNNGNTFLYCRSTDNENMYFIVYTLSSCTHNTFSVSFVSPTRSVQYSKECSFPPYNGGTFTTWSLTVNKELLIGILDSNDDSVYQQIELKINTKEVKPSTPARILTELQFEQALQANFKCCVCRKVLEYKTKVCHNGHSFCGSHEQGCSNGHYYSSDSRINNFVYDNVYELCRAHLPAIVNKLLETETVKKNKPRDNFEELKCSFCDKYLSIGPIFISFDGKFNKCGRCVDLDPETEKPLLRNYIYEKVAKQMQFPCSESSNCNEILQWEEAGKHEMTCLYRKISCPNANCTDKFEFNTVFGHFQKCHEESIFNNNTQGIITSVEIDKPKAILINSRGKYFIAYFNSTDENISFTVQALSSFGTQSEFSLSYSSQTCCIKFRNNRPIVIFDENFTDKHHEIFIDRSQLSQCLGLTETATSFKVHIRIIYTDFARSFRKALECPVCFKIMNSTINLCSTGHSVCSTCKGQIQNCPICRSSFSRHHNTPLQKMYSLFQQYIPDIYKLSLFRKAVEKFTSKCAWCLNGNVYVKRGSDVIRVADEGQLEGMTVE